MLISSVFLVLNCCLASAKVVKGDLKLQLVNGSVYFIDTSIIDYPLFNERTQYSYYPVVFTLNEHPLNNCKPPYKRYNEWFYDDQLKQVYSTEKRWNGARMNLGNYRWASELVFTRYGDHDFRFDDFRSHYWTHQHFPINITGCSFAYCENSKYVNRPFIQVGNPQGCIKAEIYIDRIGDVMEHHDPPPLEKWPFGVNPDGIEGGPDSPTGRPPAYNLPDDPPQT